MKELSLTPGAFAFVLTPVRESKLLGKRFTFERSTALGLSPDTLLHALVGFDVLQFVEKNEYKLFRALVAAGCAEETGSKLQQGTLDVLSKGMGPAGQPRSLNEIRAIPDELSTPWRILLRVMRSTLPRWERRVLARLAAFDRVAHQIPSALDIDREVERRRRVFLPSLAYWYETGLGLNWESTLVLDATLCHLAWIDIDNALLNPDAIHPFSIVGLAEPSRRPMRHWFDELLAETRCANLVALHNHLVKRRCLRHGRPISHDLLKKWASTERLMPYDAVVQLLGASNDDAFKARAHSRLCFARLLTVLGELLTCFSADPVAPKTAQSELHKRLQSLSAELKAGSGSRSLFLV